MKFLLGHEIRSDLVEASMLKHDISVEDEKHALISDLVEASMLKYEFFVRDKKHALRCDLVKASAAGNSEKVIQLLSSDVLVYAKEYNNLLFYAPLQLASANGHIKCVQILLAHGADVNAKDYFDVTALHTAAEKGHYLCLKALLDGGADSCLPSKSGYYKGGTTALHLAAANNRVDCVKELIQYGADYNAIDECGRTSLYIATKLGFRECVLAHLKNAFGRTILSLPDFETGNTPLHFAVIHRMTDCVHELLSLGSDVNHINNLGCSPLHISLIPTVNDMEILKLLVLEGYNTNINLPDAEGYLPLHYVCFSGQKWFRRPEMAKFLIAHGANVNIKNCRGISLLHCELRASEEEYEILKFIVNSMLQLPRLTNRNPNLKNNKRLLYASTHPRDIISEFFSRPPWRNMFSNEEDNVLEKKLWYDQIALNPRTLQHCCRYVVRQTLGSHKLKDVGKLPIPAALKSYMLLESEDIQM